MSFCTSTIILMPFTLSYLSKWDKRELAEPPVFILLSQMEFYSFLFSQHI